MFWCVDSWSTREQVTYVVVVSVSVTSTGKKLVWVTVSSMVCTFVSAGRVTLP